jgi:hypothetical protein
MISHETDDRRLDTWISRDDIVQAIDKDETWPPLSSSLSEPPTPSQAYPILPVLETKETRKSNSKHDSSKKVSSALPSSKEHHQHPKLEHHQQQKLTRNMKRKYEEMNLQKLSEIDPKFMELEKEREEMTKVRNIETIYFGSYQLGTWYFSPYPEEYGTTCKELFICEHCLKYMKFPEVWLHHQKTCKLKMPPGKVVYKKDKNYIFELDGKESKLYCQLLCLLSKLFLDHKTVYYDIEPFWFYVLTEVEMVGNKPVHHIVGYFSKVMNISLEP